MRREGEVAASVAGVFLLAASAAYASAQPAQAADPAARSGDAYSQFMLGRHLETADDIPGAIAAFRRAIQLDPQSSDIIAELVESIRDGRAADGIALAVRRIGQILA